MTRLCINPATTMPSDLVTDVRAYSAAGFRAMELWLDKVDRHIAAGHSLTEVASLLKDNGLVAPAACSQGNLYIAAGDERRQALDQLRRKLDTMQALNCPTLIAHSDALPTPQPRPIAPLYDLAVANFAEACDIAKPYGVRLAIEFIKGARVLGTPLTAQDVATRAGRDNGGVLFDTFHFYAGFGKLEDIDKLDGKRVFFVHVNDADSSVPREALTDKDRVFLGEGCFPLGPILDSLKKIGYDGYYSIELFNDDVWAMEPFAAARKAYQNVVEFLGPDEA